MVALVVSTKDSLASDLVPLPVEQRKINFGRVCRNSNKRLTSVLCSASFSETLSLFKSLSIYLDKTSSIALQGKQI